MFELAQPAIRRLAGPVPPRGAAVELTLVGERRMADLNRTYRNRRGAAEILTFPYGPDGGGEDPVGEIFLCWKRIEAGARDRGVEPRHWLLRLVAHGLMHLRGHLHADPAAARRMERAERRVLEGFISPRVLDRLFGGETE
ncbi:MAG: rRNA maturation RNase YbeY [Candidatus Krumholzibacteriota bacterium]|nr:rRNA maturation RNase YbeY [Candidatus Krumholzibacteriota bacterium]